MANGRPHLVFLYGPPAVGKLTVAQALAERTGFRVLHNHVTIDAVTPVFDFGTEPFFELVGRFRRELVGAAAREGVDLIYTFVFATGDESHVADIAMPFEEAGGTVTFVQLVAAPEVLLERVGSDSRAAHGKITDTPTLESLLERYDLFTTVPGRDSLTLDLGALDAGEAADRIAAHLSREE